MNPTPLKLAKDSKPDLMGPAGKAWRQDVAAALANMKRSDTPAADLTVSSWILHVPKAHPMWEYYWLGCVHLRPHPDGPPPMIFLPHATHEVMVYALNPGIDPALDDGPRLLLPANFHGQFIEPSDADAAARVQATVQEIVDGRLSPDTDFQREWVRRYSDSNLMLQESVKNWAGR